MGLRLNVGSGQRPFAKPWINIDVEERWKPDVVCDASRLPYDDGTAEMIVLHQVLEHFGCGEGQGLLRECHRVLQPSGSLLVFVPDMRALAQRWLMGKLDTQIYMTNVYGAYMGDEHDRHKWGYIHTTLFNELRAVARWQVLLDFDWRQLPGADLPSADWWMLAKEAVK